MIDVPRLPWLAYHILSVQESAPYCKPDTIKAACVPVFKQAGLLMVSVDEGQCAPCGKLSAVIRNSPSSLQGQCLEAQDMKTVYAAVINCGQ